MLKGDAETLKAYVREKDWAALDKFNHRMDVRKPLVQIFSKLFETTAVRTNPDGTSTEQVFVEYRRWSFIQIIEKLKKNWRSLDL